MSFTLEICDFFGKIKWAEPLRLSQFATTCPISAHMTTFLSHTHVIHVPIMLYSHHAHHLAALEKNTEEPFPGRLPYTPTPYPTSHSIQYIPYALPTSQSPPYLTPWTCLHRFHWFYWSFVHWFLTSLVASRYMPFPLILATNQQRHNSLQFSWCYSMLFLCEGMGSITW